LLYCAEITLVVKFDQAPRKTTRSSHASYNCISG
jgi:hypothetical protein